MSATHRIKEFIKYKRAAKGRHGVHSPFVYRFIEQVVDAHSHPSRMGEGIQREGEELNNLLIATKSFVREYFPGDTSIDILLLNRECPERWIDMVGTAGATLKHGQVIAAPTPHKTRHHSSVWSQLCAQPEVTLSIDIYKLGLLFFREEFKEKQHFILKY